MEAAVKWALAFVDRLPPVPVSNLLAPIIIVLAMAGLVRKAMRSPSPDPDPEPVPMVMLNAGGVYTLLTSIHVELQRLNGRMETMEQMLRRRQKTVRNRKKRTTATDATE